MILKIIIIKNNNMNQIIQDLNWRYATKQFDSNKKISTKQRDTIIEAFRLTASSFWLQPWKLVVVENQDIKDSLVEHSWWQQQISDCSHLLVLCRTSNFDASDINTFLDDITDTRWVSREDLEWYENLMKGFLSKMNNDEINTWTAKQVYIALWNLMTVCAHMEIDACPIEWFIGDMYDKILGLSEKWLSSVVVLPVGYRSDDDHHAEHKKVRFETNKISQII